MNMKTPDILKKIVKRKSEIVQELKIKRPLSNLKEKIEEIEKPRGFVRSLKESIKNNGVGVIAELKKASPSKGVLRESFDPSKIAKSFSDNGAACLSVLTEEDFFLGSNLYLKTAKQACKIPILRKDFIIDTYQIFESKIIGADCILLIASCLEKGTMLSFVELAHKLEMDVLIEAHNDEELELALKMPNNLIGINNRNLNNFEVDLKTTLNLQSRLSSDQLLVTESGIHTSSDVEMMVNNGISAFLVGETFMNAEDPGKKLHELFFS
mgnify:CR=1 FL=1